MSATGGFSYEDPSSPRSETSGLDARFCRYCKELTEVDAAGLCAACPSNDDIDRQMLPYLRLAGYDE